MTLVVVPSRALSFLRLAFVALLVLVACSCGFAGSFLAGGFWFACVFEGGGVQGGLASGQNLSLAVKLNQHASSLSDPLWWPGSSLPQRHAACGARTAIRARALTDRDIDAEAEAIAQKAHAARVGETSPWFLDDWKPYKETSLLWLLLSNQCSRINKRSLLACRLSNRELPSWRSQLQRFLLSIERMWTWIILIRPFLGLNVLVRLKDLFATAVWVCRS